MAIPLNASVSENQKAEAVRKITDAVRIVATLVVNNLAESGMFDSQTFQRKIIESPDFPNDLHESFRPLIHSLLVNSTRTWREKDGVIYLSVISDGMTGPEWIKRLEGSGFRLSKWAKDVLNSSDFKPTTGYVYNIAILKGNLFSDGDRVTSKIRAEADKRKLTKPNAEVACLIRENFSDEDIETMGLWWIVTMHEPIKDSVGDLRLLCAGRGGGGRWLCAARCGAGFGWGGVAGFAFVLPQDQNSVSTT